MPDENKLKAFTEQGVGVAKCCGTCEHMWTQVGAWGECKKGAYEHKKHTGGPRRLPANKFFVCPLWEGPREAGTEMGTYVELLPMNGED